jgi:hypothetical protein
MTGTSALRLLRCAGLSLIALGAVACAEDLGPERARWAELESTQRQLLGEAQKREESSTRRIAGLPKTSAGPRQELDDAAADAAAALREWEAQLKSSEQIVATALAAGDGTDAVRVLRAERARLTEAQQAVQDSHIARQRALAVVVDEVAAARNAANGNAEQLAAHARAANRAARDGGELRFAIPFDGTNVAASAEPELMRAIDFLARCPELTVDIVCGGKDAAEGRARALSVRQALERRGARPNSVRGLDGNGGDATVARVIRVCPPPPPHED